MAWELIFLALYVFGMMMIGLMMLWVDESTPVASSEETPAESTSDVKTDKQAA